MSKTVSLTKEELQDHALTLKSLADKHTSGVTKYRAKISEIESSLQGGQGDAVINALVELSKCINAIQAATEELVRKLATKVQNVSAMEENTGAYKVIQDRLDSAIAEAKNAANH